MAIVDVHVLEMNKLNGGTVNHLEQFLLANNSQYDAGLIMS
jgi:hypothetical protein